MLKSLGCFAAGFACMLLILVVAVGLILLILHFWGLVGL